MYDLKSYATQAKNLVLNVPEMEAKVLEATNDDAWSVLPLGSPLASLAPLFPTTLSCPRYGGNSVLVRRQGWPLPAVPRPSPQGVSLT